MDTSREVSDTDRRSPLIGQQGGRRPNTRLSLADHFEYFNLKNDTVAIVGDQSCQRRSGGIFQSASFKKKISLREQTRKKLRTFSPFLEGETALISADPVFPPITLLIYLCSSSSNLKSQATLVPLTQSPHGYNITIDHTHCTCCIQCTLIPN